MFKLVKIKKFKIKKCNLTHICDIFVFSSIHRITI